MKAARHRDAHEQPSRPRELPFGSNAQSRLAHESWGVGKRHRRGRRSRQGRSHLAARDAKSNVSSRATSPVASNDRRVCQMFSSSLGTGDLDTRLEPPVTALPARSPIRPEADHRAQLSSLAINRPSNTVAGNQNGTDVGRCCNGMLRRGGKREAGLACLTEATINPLHTLFGCHDDTFGRRRRIARAPPR